jgi:hypothetical protein
MQFASLSVKHQLNISGTSANTSGISELSAEYQRIIRRTSEHQMNIRATSDEHQTNISQSARWQVNINESSANYQMRSPRHSTSGRLSIRRAGCAIPKMVTGR